jgi:dephospho-CoA kinase
VIIGVTGQIGSGKSAVTAIFKALGAEVADADLIGKEVVENEPGILYRLVLEFGNSILTPHKTLSRRELGRMAFASKDATRRLNDIVHPALLKKLDDLIDQTRQNQGILIIDAALLIYWNYHKRMDLTILVSSTADRRRKRMRAKGLTEEEFRSRTASQLSERALRQVSDYVLTNNGPIVKLQKQAEKLYQDLIELG